MVHCVMLKAIMSTGRSVGLAHYCCYLELVKEGGTWSHRKPNLLHDLTQVIYWYVWLHQNAGCFQLQAHPVWHALKLLMGPQSSHKCGCEQFTKGGIPLLQSLHCPNTAGAQHE